MGPGGKMICTFTLGLGAYGAEPPLHVTVLTYNYAKVKSKLLADAEAFAAAVTALRDRGHLDRLRRFLGRYKPPLEPLIRPEVVYS